MVMGFGEVLGLAVESMDDVSCLSHKKSSAS